MKAQTFEAVGRIDSLGKLKMYMDELNDFFSQHKGQSVIATFQVVTPKSSEALRSFYYKVVVPQFQKAIWENGERLTYHQTVERLAMISPVNRLGSVPAEELTNAEMAEHIDFLKQYAAENLSLYITDPNEI